MARRLDWGKANRQPVFDNTPADPAAQARALAAKQDRIEKSQLLEHGIWPVGKHKFKSIEQLPQHYLIWAGQNIKYKNMTLTSDLRVAANNELLRRYCIHHNIPLVQI